MQLPDDSIGISDIIGWRECARRMSWGMRRHTGRGEQSDDLTPEGGETVAYGNAIHRGLQLLEEGKATADALQEAWNEYGRLLDPEDLARLQRDLDAFPARDFEHVRTIASEDDFRVPLFVHEGRTIYFRFKIDRLYERIDRPGTFIHIDYKSSKWRRSPEEVHADVQMWAYNFGIYERFDPNELVQIYDQLRHGQERTSKSAAQRREIRGWLIANVKAILADQEYAADDLLGPTLNQWCPWCPIMESCPVIPQLSSWSATRIAALAPTRKEKNEETGRQRTVTDLQHAGDLELHTSEFEKARLASKVLDRYMDAVKVVIRDMPSEQRRALGFTASERKSSEFTPAVMKELYERLGPERFFSLVSLSKTRLSSQLADDKPTLEWALGQAVEGDGALVIGRS